MRNTTLRQKSHHASHVMKRFPSPSPMDFSNLNDQFTSYCDIHPSMKRLLYCLENTCDRPICLECIKYHTGHRIGNIKTCAEHIRTVVGNQNELYFSLKSSFTKFQNIHPSVSQTLNSLKLFDQNTKPLLMKNLSLLLYDSSIKDLLQQVQKLIEEKTTIIKEIDAIIQGKGEEIERMLRHEDGAIRKSIQMYQNTIGKRTHRLQLILIQLEQLQSKINSWRECQAYKMSRIQSQIISFFQRLNKMSWEPYLSFYDGNSFKTCSIPSHTTKRMIKKRALKSFNLIALSDDVFLCGGIRPQKSNHLSGETYSNSCYQIRIVSESNVRFVPKSKMLVEAAEHSLVEGIDNCFLAIGGRNAGNLYCAFCQCYCIDKNKWEVIPELNHGRINCNGCLFGAQIVYIFGGQGVEPKCLPRVKSSKKKTFNNRALSQSIDLEYGWDNQIQNNNNSLNLPIEYLKLTNDRLKWEVAILNLKNGENWSGAVLPGVVELNGGRILIFGGEGSKDVYEFFPLKMTLKKKKEGLTSEEGFPLNSAMTFNSTVYALGSHGINLHILPLKQHKWKTISLDPQIKKKPTEKVRDQGEAKPMEKSQISLDSPTLKKNIKTPEFIDSNEKSISPQTQNSYDRSASISLLPEISPTKTKPIISQDIDEYNESENEDDDYSQFSEDDEEEDDQDNSHETPPNYLNNIVTSFYQNLDTLISGVSQKVGSPANKTESKYQNTQKELSEKKSSKNVSFSPISTKEKKLKKSISPENRDVSFPNITQKLYLERQNKSKSYSSSISPKNSKLHLNENL